MASIGELLQYAQAVQDRTTAASPQARISNLLTNAITGVMQGKEQAKQEAQQVLDRQLLLMKIQEATQKVQEGQQRAQIEGNFAKSIGLLPHTPEEKGIARSAAFQNLGGGAQTTMGDNTSQGKVATLFNLNNLDNYDMVPGFSTRGGLSFAFRKKGEASSEALNKQATYRQKVSELATKMAIMEQTAKLTAQYGDRAVGMFPNIKPTQDQWQKFLPVAESYLGGDQNAYGSFMKKQSKKNELYPLKTNPPGTIIDESLNQ